MLIASDIHFDIQDPTLLTRFESAALNRRSNPDRVVVLAGDLTQRARSSEYDQARSLVERLVFGGTSVILTPGNHDHGSVPGERLPLVGTSARHRFLELVDLVSSQPAVTARRDADTITVCGRDVFVALRSTHRGQKKWAKLRGIGRIRSEQLDWATSRLDSLDLEGQRLHLVTHRGLWALDQDRHGAIRRRRRLEERLLLPYRTSWIVHRGAPWFCDLDQTPSKTRSFAWLRQVTPEHSWGFAQ